mgnify:CR=1 FL=1
MAVFAHRNCSRGLQNRWGTTIAKEKKGDLPYNGADES